MGIFDGIVQTIKVGVDIATLPIDVVTDVVTGGQKDATFKKLSKTVGDISEISEEIVK